jgi:hypothetical protein
VKEWKVEIRIRVKKILDNIWIKIFIRYIIFISVIMGCSTSRRTIENGNETANKDPEIFDLSSSKKVSISE